MYMSKKIRNILLQILVILLGNTVYCLGIVMFVLPNGLMTGGTTGLALASNYYFNIPVSVFVYCFNITMFILGLVILGKKFAFTTLVSTFYYPTILSILKDIPALRLELENPFLAVLFGGAIIGLGVAIVLRVGASTGGMDIPPLILQKKFGIPVSVSFYVFDVIILGCQMILATKEMILYGILLVFTYTFIMDKVLFYGKKQVQVKIISNKYEAINHAITRELDSGSTLLEAQTGHFRNDCLMVMTIIAKRELSKLNDKVLEIDPDAFMIINEVYEVKGHGFTLQREYKEITKANNL